MRNPLFFISFLLFPTVLSAQIPDLNVTAFHVLGNNSGSLSIVISPDYPPPFSLIITGPNGYTFNTTMTTNSYNLSGLSIGEYCVSVSNGAGCIASLCIKIKKCNTYIFRGIVYTSCLDDAPTGDPDILYAKGRRIIVSDLIPTEPNMNISTALLSNGIYLLNVVSENKQNTVKVIVLR